MDKEVKGLLEKKLNKMKKLFNVTESISDAARQEDAEELLKFLKSRQQLMDDIDQIDGQLLNFFNDDAKALIKFVLNGDNEIQVIHNNIMSQLKKIKELDDKNLEDIKALFSKLKQDIHNLKRTETALKGYGIIGTGSQDGAFIDTKK